MSYTNPTLTTDLAAAIAMQAHPRPRPHRQPVKNADPYVPVLTLTQSEQHTNRLHAFADLVYIGDVMEFGSGWRAYPPGDDYSLPGVHRYSVQAAAALVARP